MIVHIDVLVHVGTIQQGGEIELLVASNNLKVSSSSSVEVVSDSQRVMSEWNLVEQLPVFSVVHVDISEEQVGLVNLGSDKFNFWSVDLPLVSSEWKDVGGVVVAKHLIIVVDLVWQVSLGDSTSNGDISRVSVG
jgi:hypothetical protein